MATAARRPVKIKITADKINRVTARMEKVLSSMVQWEHLKSGWTSAADAFRELGTMKLPTRVSDFRKQGIQIEQRTVKTVNRFGKTIYHNEYRIKEENA